MIMSLTIPQMTTGTFAALLLLVASFALSTLLLTLAQYATTPEDAPESPDAPVDAADLADLLAWVELQARAHTPDTSTAPDGSVAPSEARDAVWWDTWL